MRVGTRFVEVGGTLEEARQRGLQDHDEVLQLLGHAHQEILVDQVVFGLLQRPATAHVPERIGNQCLRSRRVHVARFPETSGPADEILL